MDRGLVSGEDLPVLDTAPFVSSEDAQDGDKVSLVIGEESFGFWQDVLRSMG